MSVYVDRAIWPWRGKRWAHLFADTIEELHQFAKGIRLRREWFQDKPGWPHYDVTSNTRALAIAAGAIAVEREEVVALLKASRARLKEANHAE